LAGPAAYALNTAATPHTGSIVTAGPVSGGRGGGGSGSRGDGQRNQPGQSDGSQAGRGAGSGQTGDQSGSGRPGNRPDRSGTADDPSAGGRSGQDGRGTGGAPGGGPSQDQRAGTGQSDGRQPSSTGSGRGGGGMGGLLDGASVSGELVTLLQQGAEGHTWVAAAIGAQNAASYQLAGGHPVMAIGGFNGSDPSPTLAQFQQYVAQGRVHYFLGGELGGRQNGGSDAAKQIAAWVAENFTATTVGGTTVYDLTQGG
ncbi:MAG: hypothetical protein KIT69_17085, partial [Propionibacteriaceae bacterium]|nr:hypothetical protein [Propionibacteriaceae bacterium]